MYDTDFIIEMRSPVGRTICRFRVEVIYQSEKVERYRLSGGKKELILEKKMETFHSWKNWRVLDINYIIEDISEKTIATLHWVYKLIDEKRFGKQLCTYRLPAFRNGGADNNTDLVPEKFF